MSKFHQMGNIIKYREGLVKAAEEGRITAAEFWKELQASWSLMTESQKAEELDELKKSGYC